MLQSEVLLYIVACKLATAHRVREESQAALSAEMPELKRLEEGRP